MAIAAGDYHTVGLTDNGRVLYAGAPDDNNVDQNGYVKGWNNIVAVSAGKDYTLGLTSDGDVLSFGAIKQNQRPTSGEWDDIMTYDWEGLKKLLEQPITE